LISWFLFRAPGQALVHCAALLELVRRSFVLQLELAANTLYLVTFTLLAALLAAALIIVVTRNHELRHGWQEHLSRFTGSGSAKKWPWVFLVVPYAVGLGLALPTVAFLGFLWPSLKLRERSLLVLLVAGLAAAPFATATMGRLARPLDQEQAPFYGTLALENQPYSEAQHRRLAELAERHPKQPFLRFALAWSARRGGDPATAEAAYRRTLELWPDDDRVLNNLGNALAVQGRDDEALKLYKRATMANRANAAAYFNIAQTHTKRFDFRAANDALAHASALDFELVSSHQKQTTEDRPMPLVDQWIAPQRFWDAMEALPNAEPSRASLPPLWRGRIEFSGWPFSLAVLGCAILGIAAGLLQHRVLPLRRCGNCDRVVCRRCAKRRREVGLCRACAAVEARAQSPEFARTLLLEHRRRTGRPIDLARTVLAVLIPGFGMAAYRRVFVPLFLLVASMMLLAARFHVAAPFAYEPHLDFLGKEHSLVMTIVPWALIYATSILGYFAERSQHEARRNAASPRPSRGRGTTVLRRVADAA
jgi:tetratricopeptide (TPR) repeat protein